MRIIVHFSAALIVAATGNVAFAECTKSGASFPIPNAISALAEWQDARNTRISIAATASVLLSYCEAATLLAEDKRLSPSVIDQYSRIVIFEYLDRLKDTKEFGPSVGSLLRSNLGMQGFARPQVKQWASLTIKYVHDVDSIRIGDEAFAPWPSFIVTPGTMRLVGTKRNKVVCSGDIEITLTPPATFSC